MSEEKTTQEKENKNEVPSNPFNQKVIKMAWDEKRCKKFANRFETLEEWATGHQSSYKAAVAHGWVKACTEHMSDTSVPDHIKTYKPSA